MYSPKKKLNAPGNFQFPFTPYKIQSDLMKELYQILENKEIGIFESPTGTGKSLTLTCSPITWFLDHKSLVNSELDSEIEKLAREIAKSETETGKSVDWITEQFADIQKKKSLVELKRIQAALNEHEEKIKELKESYNNLGGVPGLQATGISFQIEEELDEFDVLNDFEEDSASKTEEIDDEMKPKMVKLFFASRTHSQLSQVINEIKKSPFGKDIRCTTLASRQNLCINPNVSVHGWTK
uniref:Helicase ATP-binding domain-containing protein n=1 Tax=Megaselia scalaris TaxID=36166 RepID=T1GAE6_MEGSC